MFDGCSFIASLFSFAKEHIDIGLTEYRIGYEKNDEKLLRQAESTIEGGKTVMDYWYTELKEQMKDHPNRDNILATVEKDKKAVERDLDSVIALMNKYSSPDSVNKLVLDNESKWFVAQHWNLIQCTCLSIEDIKRGKRGKQREKIREEIKEKIGRK